MKSHQVYKAYLAGMDITQLAAATGYGYAAIDQIIQQESQAQQMHGLFQKNTSSFRSYGRGEPTISRNALSASSAVRTQAQQQLQSGKVISDSTQAAIKQAVDQVKSQSEYGTATTDSLIDALFSLDLIKDIPWLNVQASGGYAQTQRQRLKGPVQVLLPLVQRGVINPTDMAAALKDESAAIVSNILAVWPYSAYSIAQFKDSLSTLDQQRLQSMMTLRAKQKRLGVLADIVKPTNATYAESLNQQARGIIGQINNLEAQLLSAEAVRGTNIDHLKAFIQYKLAATTLATVAAYKPAYTEDQVDNTSTAAISDVIGKSTEGRTPKLDDKTLDDLNKTTDVTDPNAAAPEEVAAAVDAASDKADATNMVTSVRSSMPLLVAAGILVAGLYWWSSRSAKSTKKGQAATPLSPTFSVQRRL